MLRLIYLGTFLFYVVIACNNQVGVQNKSFVLAGEEATVLVGHCSSKYSEGVTGYWVPSEQDIRPLEEAFPDFLSPHPGQIENLNIYQRQYAGVIKANRRLIFINGFSSELGKAFAERLDLSRKALVLCGGGNSVYGLEYDVESKTFKNLTFNPPR